MQHMERDECIERLKEYVTDIESLVSVVGQPHLNRADKDRARDLLKALKGRLDADCMAMRSAQSQEEIGAMGRVYFRPAAYRAHEIVYAIKATSAPSGNWNIRLHSARVEIEDLLRQLENHPAGGAN
jgi:hypothetical protein